MGTTGDAEPAEMVDNTLIGADKSAVTPDGATIPLNKLTVEQMQTELRGRGLDATGKKRQLQRKVQARGLLPIPFLGYRF